MDMMKEVKKIWIVKIVIEKIMNKMNIQTTKNMGMKTTMLIHMDHKKEERKEMSHIILRKTMRKSMKMMQI